MSFDLQAALDAFWEARARGDHFPTEWFDRLDFAQAYQVQLGMIALRCLHGERQIGWKVGLTSPAIQQQFGFTEPVFGCLLADGVKRSGHVFRGAELIEPGFEVEICVRMRSPLAGPADRATVRRAIGVCYPALEIIETRGDFRAQLTLALADNAQQKAIVLGDPVPVGAEPDFSGIVARVSINRAEAASGRGDGVLGDPLNSVAWLARKLPEFGRSLREGDLIMTGSFTRQFPLAPGDCVRAEFAGVGAVETRLEA